MGLSITGLIHLTCGGVAYVRPVGETMSRVISAVSSVS